MMLLDTCAFIWLILNPTFLSPSAKAAIHDESGSLFISNATAFEIGRLVKKKKIALPKEARTWYYFGLEYYHIQEIPLTSELIFLAEDLPDLHHDPMDRIIIATAMAYNLSIVTPDQSIAQYPKIKTIW